MGGIGPREGKTKRENNEGKRFNDGKGCDYILQGEQRGRERLRTL